MVYVPKAFNYVLSYILKDIRIIPTRFDITSQGYLAQQLPNGTTRMTLPTDSYIDLRTLSIDGTVNLPAPGANNTYIYRARNWASLIRSLVLKSNGNDLFPRVDYYNLLYNRLYDYTADRSADTSIGAIYEGTRQSRYLTAASEHEFVINKWLPCIPNYVISTSRGFFENFELEITWASNNEVYGADVQLNGNYTINNLRGMVNCIKFTDMGENLFAGAIAKLQELGGYKPMLHIKGYTYSSGNIPLNANTELQIPFSNDAEILTKVIIVPTAQDHLVAVPDATRVGSISSFTSYTTGITGYQVHIGDESFPKDFTLTAKTGFYETLKAFGKNQDVSSGCLLNDEIDFSGAEFVCANSTAAAINNSHLLASSAALDGGYILYWPTGTIPLFPRNDTAAADDGYHVPTPLERYQQYKFMLAIPFDYMNDSEDKLISGMAVRSKLARAYLQLTAGAAVVATTVNIWTEYHCFIEVNPTGGFKLLR